MSFTRKSALMLAAVTLLPVIAQGARAQEVIVLPPATYYHPVPPLFYHSPPTITYYSPRTVYDPLPIVSYYAPRPPVVSYLINPVTTTRYGPLGRPRVTTEYVPVRIIP